MPTELNVRIYPQMYCELNSPLKLYIQQSPVNSDAFLRFANKKCQSTLSVTSLRNIIPMDRPLTIKQVCEITTLSRSTIYRLIRRNRFPKGKVAAARRRIWLENDIINWIQDLDENERNKD